MLYVRIRRNVSSRCWACLPRVLHHNVVNVDFHSSIDQGFEDLCHQPLISSANILELKWYNFVAVQPVWCHNVLIWLEHGDLVVPE